MFPSDLQRALKNEGAIASLLRCGCAPPAVAAVEIGAAKEPTREAWQKLMFHMPGTGQTALKTRREMRRPW